jgi:hypothetical protein
MQIYERLLKFMSYYLNVRAIIEFYDPSLTNLAETGFVRVLSFSVSPCRNQLQDLLFNWKGTKGSPWPPVCKTVIV